MTHVPPPIRTALEAVRDAISQGDPVAAARSVPTTTTLPHYAAVTLPREPWEVGA